MYRVHLQNNGNKKKKNMNWNCVSIATDCQDPDKSGRATYEIYDLRWSLRVNKLRAFIAGREKME